MMISLGGISILCLTSRMTVMSAHIPEEDARPIPDFYHKALIILAGTPCTTTVHSDTC